MNRSSATVSVWRALLLTIVLLACCDRVQAQATSVVQISGTVQDPKESVVPGTEIKAVQTATGFTRSATSGPDGSYVLPSLPVGPYRIEATANGFSPYMQQGIVLQVNTNPVINITLQLGTIDQVVEVHANALMTETQTNSISQVIDERRVVDLPLNGRQPTQLILLSGAAVTAPPSDLASSKNYPTSAPIAVAGGQANGTYYLVDGGDYNDAFGAINLPLPFPDALQEFSVQTSAIPASYGVRAGAVVNIITKSGTNEFHGNVFNFLRTGATNAKNFFASERDALKRNQFGGTIGGPIVHNKLFFFGGYQGTRTRTAPATNTVFVPTAQILRGDFSTLTSTTCSPTARTLYDPLTGAPFPGNQVPRSRFSPQALAFLQYVPTSQDPCGRLQNAIPNNSDEDQFITRGDWQMSTRNTLFGRYFFTDLRNPGVFNDNLLLTTRAGILGRVQALVIGDTFTISPRVINSFHGTWARERITRGPASGLPTSADIGLNVAPSPGNFPMISVSGRFSTFCGTCSLAQIYSGSLQFADDLTWTTGRHQLTIGANYIRRYLDFQVSTQQNPAFAFNGQATSNPSNRTGGDPLLDLLLGAPSQFIQGNLTQMNMIQNYIGLYVDDKFRLNSRISINLGLRWEPYFPAYDTKGRATHFELADYQAGRRTTVFQNAPPGVFFAGDPGFPKAGTEGSWKNFAPRVGLVWDLGGNGRTVIRTAYGIQYDIPPLQFMDRFGFGPPWASTITLTNLPGGFADPFRGFPGGNPFPQPQPPPANAVFPAGGQFINLPSRIRLPYMQQWNLSVQRQIGADWLVSANYIGNKGTHRWLVVDANPGVFIPGTCGSQPCSTTGNVNSRRLLSRLNPTEGSKFSSLATVDDGGNNSYNGLLLSVNRRLQSHFSVLANYTWSHCLSEGGDLNSEVTVGSQNPYDRASEKSNCRTDVRHLFNLSLVVETPRWRGNFLKKAVSDWELAAIVTKRSGFWFPVSTGRDNSLTGIGQDRPDVVGDHKLDNPTLDRWFNTSAFVANKPGQFGNAARNPLEGPGAFNMDIALIRRIRIGERHSVQIRAEAFNVLNHPTFGNPRSSLADTSFGRILSANDPRIMQFALKYAF
ncbi:MAG: TonB-dependent receptor [Pyrinomonadaceae bacterium]|nr:TonB-dependent receptor [Pyrinomonadaceae bacterium]